MISKINKTSKILVISGLLVSVINVFSLDNDWIEMGCFSVCLVGIILSKKDIVAADDYGIYLYYLILGLYLFLIIGLWF